MATNKQLIQNLEKRLEKLVEEVGNTVIESGSKKIEKHARNNFMRFIPEVSADDPFVEVYRTVAKTKQEYSATITCTGKQVLFIEFGAGAMNTFNEQTNRPTTSTFGFLNNVFSELAPRPVGIVPLGHYGKGRGMDTLWVRPAQIINYNAGESEVLDRKGQPREGVAWTKGHRPARALWRARNSGLKDMELELARYIRNSKYGMYY